MSSKSKKILVTGVAGFLGSHLSEKLVELGHKVIDLKRVEVASIKLGNLKEGSWKQIKENEWYNLLN